MEVIPTGSALGAEVRGADLNRPLSKKAVEILRKAFLDNCVLYFGDLEISEEDQVRFTRYFGDPIPHVRKQADRPIEEIFIISNVREDGKPVGALGNEEILYHSDLSYMASPGLVSMLYAVEVPSTGGDTMWVNLYKAYDALDEELRAEVEGLRAVHLHPIQEQNPPEPACHPIIRTHPETGRKLVYVSPHLTSHIDGKSQAESEQLLDRLIRHSTQEKFVWTHKWRPRDLVMWDNRCTMHRRESFDDSQRRLMKRTQTLGDVPF